MRLPVPEDADNTDTDPWENNLQPIYYDSTVSEHSTPSHEDQPSSNDVPVIGYPPRPRTPQPEDAVQGAEEGALMREMVDGHLPAWERRPAPLIPRPTNGEPSDFLPTISINVPSRRTHRRLNRRTAATTWYGSTILSQNNTAGPYPRRPTSPSRIPEPLYHRILDEPNYPEPIRSSDPGPAYPGYPVRDPGFSEPDHSRHAPPAYSAILNRYPLPEFSSSASNETNSPTSPIYSNPMYPSLSNPEVARFIHPTFAILANLQRDANIPANHHSAFQPFSRNGAQTQTTQSTGVQDRGLQTGPERGLQPPLPSPSAMSVGTQTDQELAAPNQLHDTEQLEYDDSGLLLTDHLTDIFSFNRPSGAREVDTPPSAPLGNNSEACSSGQESTSSLYSQMSGLARRSRSVEIEDPGENDTTCSSSSSSSSSSSCSLASSSTPTRQQPTPEIDRSTPTLEETVVAPSHTSSVDQSRNVDTVDQSRNVDNADHSRNVDTVDLHSRNVDNANLQSRNVDTVDLQSRNVDTGDQSELQENELDDLRSTVPSNQEIQIDHPINPEEQSSSHRTELHAEIVVNNTPLQHGRCRIIFDSLHSDDITHLLSQHVRVHLDEGNTLRLDVTPEPRVGAGIYRPITRYLEGLVPPPADPLKRVSFNEAVQEEEYLVTASSSTSTSMQPAVVVAENWSDNEQDFISDIEDFELD